MFIGPPIHLIKVNIYHFIINVTYVLAPHIIATWNYLFHSSLAGHILVLPAKKAKKKSFL